MTSITFILIFFQKKYKRVPQLFLFCSGFGNFFVCYEFVSICLNLASLLRDLSNFLFIQRKISLFVIQFDCCLKSLVKFFQKKFVGFRYFSMFLVLFVVIFRYSSF